jgi:hypothetical protein
LKKQINHLKISSTFTPKNGVFLGTVVRILTNRHRILTLWMSVPTSGQKGWCQVYSSFKMMHMKSKRGPGRPKKAEDGVGAADGLDGQVAKAAGGGDGLDDQVVQEGGADRGRQPEGTEEGDDRVIHNGSAGAFEAAEDGRYEEDSDEDNDDLAMGH